MSTVDTTANRDNGAESPEESTVNATHEAEGSKKSDDTPDRRLRVRLSGLAGSGKTGPQTVVAILAGIVVVLLVVAGYYVRKNSADEAVETARTDALRAGTSAVGTLLSYDYREIDEAIAARADLVTGAFADKYVKLVTDQVAPAAKKQKVVTRTEVASAGVIDATEERVNLIVFVNQVSAKAGSDVPVLSGSRIRVGMRRVGETWRVASVDPV